MDPKALPPQFPLTFFDRHAHRNGSPRPLAVFDCDGTIIQGDIGESMFYRQIEQFAFRMSPADIWQDHPQRTLLAESYETLAATSPSTRQSHPVFETFARLLVGRYQDQLAEGKIAKACAEIVALFAGFSLPEVRSFADETYADELRGPMTRCSLGGRSLPRGIRFLRESVALLQALQVRGFDIYAVSGSSKWSVEPVFRQCGVPEECVIGIDLQIEDGILTTRPRLPVPIHGGKIERLRQEDPRAPVLVASDSRNDIPLLLASTDVKVYVNSHNRKTEDFFTLGKISRDDSWIVFEKPTMLPN